MCGLTGFLTRSPTPDDAAVLDRMTSTLVHRGPDGSGTWSDPEAGLHLGHRRLAVIDLSDEGRQPMVSASGRFVVVYNGEIYNHPELGRELAGRGAAFRGTSDTEVLLAAIEAWGVEEALRRCVGMFAFALWDRAERRLVLARDRLGEKPLYYGWAGRSFLFGSELKALREHPEWRGEIDRDALADYLVRGVVPAPASIHVGMRKLPPGALLDARGRRGARRPARTGPLLVGGRGGGGRRGAALRRRRARSRRRARPAAASTRSAGR